MRVPVSQAVYFVLLCVFVFPHLCVISKLGIVSVVVIVLIQVWISECLCPSQRCICASVWWCIVDVQKHGNFI